MSSSNQKKARIDALESRIGELEDFEQRARDGQKMAFGTMIAFASMLIAFAWYGGHQTYKKDIETIQSNLTTANTHQYDEFIRKLDSEASGRSRGVAQQLLKLEQRLNARIAQGSGLSAEEKQRLAEEVHASITAINQQWEIGLGGVLGWACFDRALAAYQTVNRDVAITTEFFLRAALFFARSNEEAMLNTTLSRLSTLCWNSLRAQDFATRPMINDYYREVVSELQKRNVNGRYEVALRELQTGYNKATQRK
ncbi:MAG: hypothetical protein CMO80_06985 [Verrucomicrobiales bacterium]|nr:hypothetical protein [Verrucomicrobiales bacterium]|tara:strand:- start:3406 stop:4167 length:762 start_codon:yes stop_codon:yes gene_type:complete